MHKIADRTLSSIAFDSQDRMHIISAKKNPQQANRNTIVRGVSVLDTVNHSIMSTTIKYTGYQWSSSGTLAIKSDDSTVSTHGTENEAGPMYYGGTLSANRTVNEFIAWNTIIALDAQERSHIAYDAGYETYDSGFTNRPFDCITNRSAGLSTQRQRRLRRCGGCLPERQHTMAGC